MSSAFDTIDREELMTILEEFLDEDEMRMCRLLLINTTMTLRFENGSEQTFATNKGSTQGDAISGVFLSHRTSQRKEIAEPVLSRHSFEVNSDKWEHTNIVRDTNIETEKS